MKRHEYAMDGYAGYAYPSIGFMDMLVNIKPLLLLLLLLLLVVVVVVVVVVVSFTYISSLFQEIAPWI